MNSRKLQGIGNVNAVKAEELAVGSVTVWNYGYLATVESIAPKGTKFLTFGIRSHHNGALYFRNMKRDRLVGVQI